MVTNFHVIQAGQTARVTLADQTTWKAALVGAFPDRDLAVLRIDAPKEKLKPIPVGGSRKLQVGQKVYAIGKPFGLDQTLTSGIISALNREIESATQRSDPGRDSDGCRHQSRQFGRSAAGLRRPADRGQPRNLQSVGGSAGIGFAIPVDEVNRIVPRLIRDGKFIRPALGIQAAGKSFQDALGLPKGVAVIGVLRDTPAHQAGLRPLCAPRTAVWWRAMSLSP